MTALLAGGQSIAAPPAADPVEVRRALQFMAGVRSEYLEVFDDQGRLVRPLDQLGFRVPLVAVSAFAKAHYVSHVVDSHTSFLAMIEKRFSLPSLTARDPNADTLEDMFDFDTSPSLNAVLGTAQLPKQPPAIPTGADAGCPF